ncbi:unnamed protein product [Oikopleura dioica]|uniref:Right handed beta helix domain-containing protein n=1 Tax=Oikopleura dioica TaxID=34765 RepID=E4WSB3_OIKDI|nr:unnamed protein product [Oikopleura dioica]
MSIEGPTDIDVAAPQKELDAQLDIKDVEDTLSENTEESQCGDDDESKDFQTLIELDPLKIHLQQRYWFYCREWGLSRMQMKDVYNAVLQEASGVLNPDPSDPPFLCKSEDDESIFYWQVMNIQDGFAECRSLEDEEVEHIHINDLEILYSGDEDFKVSQERQLIMDMYNFFTTFVYPPWGQLDESMNEVPFEPLLRERLNLFNLLASDHVPKHAEFRYRVQKMEFEQAYEDLDRLTATINEIQNELEESEEEKAKLFESMYNQYAKVYRYWLYHAEGLQKMEAEIWEKYHITPEGPIEVVRKINGPRPENEGAVHHLVAEMLTMKDIKELNLDEDAKVRSYATLDLTEALQACHEGDTIILFPGTYEIPYLCDYLFHESITIKGCTDNANDIDLMASDRQRFFILADAVDLKLQNLTLNAQYHTEGAICIRGGSVTLDNVIIRTDEVTRGIVIHPFSDCKMTDCEVEGKHDISVDIKEGAVLTRKGTNKFSVEPVPRKIRAPVIIDVNEVNQSKAVDPVEPVMYAKQQPAPVSAPQEGAGDVIST